MPDGRILAWSGRVDDDGRGPVDKGAHFYRSFLHRRRRQSDQQAQRLAGAQHASTSGSSRPAPPTPSTYLLDIPHDAEGPITLEARLNYRKFTDYFTQFSFAGVAKPGSGRSRSFDSREYTFDLQARSRPADRHVATATRDRPARRDQMAAASFASRTASAGTIGASACSCRAI